MIAVILGIIGVAPLVFFGWLGWMYHRAPEGDEFYGVGFVRKDGDK